MKDLDYYLNKTSEVGYIKSSQSSLVYVEGLPSLKPNELVVIEGGYIGQVISMKSDVAEILLFQRKSHPLGTKVVRTDAVIAVRVSENILGNVITPLGDLLYSFNGKSNYEDSMPLPVHKGAPGLADRVKISEPLYTGVAIIDLMVPLGKGQRELIIGDRKTGKTAFAQQLVLNQIKNNAVCVYACIGKTKDDVRNLIRFLSDNGISDRVVIVASYSDDAAGQVYTTPYAAMSVAEHLMARYFDVVVILDDLTTHAQYYREVSLLAKRFPGRESYPGDIFYIHSHLLERAGNFKSGSITCLPIVNTIEGDISGYIQTNLMSMTDGHVFFDKDMFFRGQRPAVNHYISVTRVGRQTQSQLRWSINRELNSFFALYKRTQNFVHFGAELNEGIRSTLNLGDKLYKLFNQSPGVVFDMNLQIFMFTYLWSGTITSKDDEYLDTFFRKAKDLYDNNSDFRNLIDNLIANSVDLNSLLGNIMRQIKLFEEYFA